MMKTTEEVAGASFPVLDIPDDVLRPIADYASYQWLEDDAVWAATIPAFRGVIATGAQAACREELVSVLREWLSFKVWRRLPVPDIPGLDVRAYAAR